MRSMTRVMEMRKKIAMVMSLVNRMKMKRVKKTLMRTLARTTMLLILMPS